MKRLPDLDALPDTMSEAEFWDLFGKTEHEGLDFKERISTGFQETIAAMAMSEGGCVLLGVSDDRVLKGCPDSQQTVDRISEQVSACAVAVPVKRRGILVGQVQITVVEVRPVPDHIVTTSSGRLLRRVGSSNIPLRGDEVVQFVLARLPAHVTPEQLTRAVERAKQAAVSSARSYMHMMGL